MVHEKKYRAIVLGASAGGLFALSSVLQKLPSTYPVPVIIVQHRAKDQKELLEEILRHKCQIKIKQADEKEKITGECVYIAPPDYHLLVENDFTFSLAADEQVKHSRPSIDVLFESAASVYKEGLVGIILTGASSDGAEGMATIHKYGGLTIAQLPSEAQNPFMPQAAIDKGCVKFVWPLVKIRDFLLTINLS